MAAATQADDFIGFANQVSVLSGQLRAWRVLGVAGYAIVSAWLRWCRVARELADAWLDLGVAVECAHADADRVGVRWIAREQELATRDGGRGLAAGCVGMESAAPGRLRPVAVAGW